MGQTETQSNTAGDSAKMGSTAEGTTKTNEQKIEKIKHSKQNEYLAPCILECPLPQNSVSSKIVQKRVS